MKIANRRANGLIVIMGAAGWLTGCSDASLVRCEGVPFTGPGDHEILVLAQAIGGKVQVPAPAGLSSADGPSDVPAYRFVVDRIANRVELSPGPPPAWEIGGSPMSPSDTFMVVPWLHDRKCGRVAWNSDDWIADGTAVVFRFSEGRFYRGMHVFDVLAAYWPYPVGSAWAEVESGGSGDREKWQTAPEYFRMMSLLPRMDPTRSRAEQLRALEGSFRTGPTHWLDKHPGREVIRHAREWAAAETEGRARQ